MVIVRLWGGLGNQMFQYAFGYAMARELNVKLKLDTRFFTDEYIERNKHFSKQELNLFQLPIKYRTEVNRDGSYKGISALQNRQISRLIRIPPRFSIITESGLVYIKETRLDYLKYLADNPVNNAYYDGYWQSEEYFKKYKDELKIQFTLDNSRVNEYVNRTGINCTNSVAVHMRMGDYVNSKKLLRNYNYIINPVYYIKAMDRIKNEIDSPKFFIFSNNIIKAMELLDDRYDVVFVNSDRYYSDVEEFSIMSRCSNHIISNSTFSWWAAWLSNCNSINIAPDVFFGNKSIVPKSWIKVPFNK